MQSLQRRCAASPVAAKGLRQRLPWRASPRSMRAARRRRRAKRTPGARSSSSTDCKRRIQQVAGAPSPTSWKTHRARPTVVCLAWSPRRPRPWRSCCRRTADSSSTTPGRCCATRCPCSRRDRPRPQRPSCASLPATAARYRRRSERASAGHRRPCSTQDFLMPAQRATGSPTPQAPADHRLECANFGGRRLRTGPTGAREAIADQDLDRGADRRCVRSPLMITARLVCCGVAATLTIDREDSRRRQSGRRRYSRSRCATRETSRRTTCLPPLLRRVFNRTKVSMLGTTGCEPSMPNARSVLMIIGTATERSDAGYGEASAAMAVPLQRPDVGCR